MHHCGKAVIFVDDYKLDTSGEKGRRTFNFLFGGIVVASLDESLVDSGGVGKLDDMIWVGGMFCREIGDCLHCIDPLTYRVRFK